MAEGSGFRIVKGIDNPNTCLYLESAPHTPLKKKNCDQLASDEGIWEEHNAKDIPVYALEALVCHPQQKSESVVQVSVRCPPTSCGNT
jgi:hypothetical protein